MVTWVFHHAPNTLSLFFLLSFCDCNTQRATIKIHSLVSTSFLLQVFILPFPHYLFSRYASNKQYLSPVGPRKKPVRQKLYKTCRHSTELPPLTVLSNPFNHAPIVSHSSSDICYFHLWWKWTLLGYINIHSSKDVTSLTSAFLCWISQYMTLAVEQNKWWDAQRAISMRPKEFWPKKEDKGCGNDLRMSLGNLVIIVLFSMY